LQSLHERRQDIELLTEVCQTLTEAGASALARRIRTEPATADGGDAVLVADWMLAWNWAVLIGQTAGVGQQQLLQDLSEQRAVLETRLRELFEDVVVARMHLALVQNTSSAVRQAFTMFTTTSHKLAATCSGPSAFRLRQVAREGLENCHQGIPCQLMPAWRVAEQLPPRLDAFDLIIIDDASRSDLRELTTLLRGRKILAVAEDRPSEETIVPDDRDIREIIRAPRGGVPIPIRQLMPPKTALCDLLNALFPDRVIRLREHARRVAPIALPMLSPPQPFIPPQSAAATAYSAPAALAGAAEPRLPVTRPAHSLEDEIATVAENLSIARRDQRDALSEPTERPAPDWLRSGIIGGAPADEARASRRSGHDVASEKLDVSPLDAPSPALPPW
ncbi:MAG: helicase, partial [Bradyrhizobium sp.]